MHRVRLAVRENRLTSSDIRGGALPPAIGGYRSRLGRRSRRRDRGRLPSAMSKPATYGLSSSIPITSDAGTAAACTTSSGACGCSPGVSKTLWLTTGPNTRAQGFYEAAGWRCAAWSREAMCGMSSTRISSTSSWSADQRGTGGRDVHIKDLYSIIVTDETCRMPRLLRPWFGFHVVFEASWFVYLATTGSTLWDRLHVSGSPFPTPGPESSRRQGMFITVQVEDTRRGSSSASRARWSSHRVSLA